MLVRKCDLCGNPAEVDTKTIYGYWAYLCHACNQRYGIKAFQTKLANLSEGGAPVEKNCHQYQYQNQAVWYYERNPYRA